MILHVVSNNRHGAQCLIVVSAKKHHKALRYWNGERKPFFSGSNFNSLNFAEDDLISVLETRGTNCPDKSIPDAEERHREASPDILKGSRLIRVSASTNREERSDGGKEMEVKTEVAEEGESVRRNGNPVEG